LSEVSEVSEVNDWSDAAMSRHTCR
jgi:hypothetical protein